MKRFAYLLILTLLSTALGHAKWVHEPVKYELDGDTFRGHLVYKESAAMGSHNLPCIYMVPNWMGPDTPATLKKAKKIAGDQYAVFIADMYGTGVRPTNAKEAGKAAGFVRGDRMLMRERADKGLEVFHAQATSHPINTKKTLGIGFCFGGGTILEYARSGAKDLKGIVTFHADLVSPTLEDDADQVKIPLLVLHGADDPYVPQKDVQAFISAMKVGKVDDWTLVQFSETVHSFTDPTAKSKGAHYNKRSAKRAFEMMEDFAAETLEL